MNYLNFTRAYPQDVSDPHNIVEPGPSQPRAVLLKQTLMVEDELGHSSRFEGKKQDSRRVFVTAAVV